MNKPHYLFVLTLIIIVGTYLMLLGEVKTMLLITNEYLLILLALSLFLPVLFFKFKLWGLQRIDFLQNTPTLKSTVGFFLVFQVIDYYYEKSIEGVVSLWFMYWIMGLIALLVLENINLYKNYKLLKSFK